MTEKLRTLLHDRATDVDFATPDLDTLVRAGDRRRRRRTLAVVGGVAALAVAGALVVPALSGGGGQPPTADDPPSNPPAALSWATGSVIHTGDQRVDVGVPVAAYVVNDAGYVFAGTDDSVYAVVGGEVSPIGRTDADSATLVTDRDGSLVGWVSTEGDAPTYVVHDLATGSQVIESTSDAGPRPRFYALDGNTAYWRDERGAVAVDVTTGEVEVVRADAGEETGFDLVDVEDGVLALYGGQGVEVGTSADDLRPIPGVQESTGELSPSATRYAPDADELRVVGVDGTDLTPTLTGYYFATVYEWAGDDTVHVIALEDERSPFDLLTCSIPTGDCEVVVDGVGGETDFQLPFGVPLGS